MRRIAIIGAGAIGSSLGGLLGRAGHDVTLIGRSAHVDAVRTGGLHVDGVLGSFTVNVAASESLQAPPDLVFLTVKSQDVAAAVQANATVLAGASIVTFQNGVRSDELVRSCGARSRTRGSRASSSNFHASFLEPGQVTILYAGPLVVGRPFGANDAELDAIAGILPWRRRAPGQRWPWTPPTIASPYRSASSLLAFSAATTRTPSRCWSAGSPSPAR